MQFSAEIIRGDPPISQVLDQRFLGIQVERQMRHAARQPERGEFLNVSLCRGMMTHGMYPPCERPLGAVPLDSLGSSKASRHLLVDQSINVFA